VEAPASTWKWLLSGEWRRGPPIVSVLMRSATISTAHEQAAARAYTDILISPDIGPVEIREWKAYQPAVDAGYRAAQEALSKLDKPVTEYFMEGGLLAELPVDPGAVRDRVAVGERGGQRLDVVDLHAGASGDDDDLVPVVLQSLGQVSSDEPGPTGDGHSHAVSFAC
jgi:hypothetical protein